MMLSLSVCALSLVTQGQRPYEMVWANRTDDDHPALVTFDDATGWTVACDNAEATLEPSTEQLLFRDHVTRLQHKRVAAGPTKVMLTPPAPIDMPTPFDSLNFWVYGNNWAFAPDPSTPPVTMTIFLGSSGAPDVTVNMGAVYWQEWWVMHRRLTADQIAMLGDRPQLRRIEVTGGTNRDLRTIYLANLSAYTEPLAPLQYEPRPKRNLTPLPGEDPGTNTGPGTLPFPTREETILPDTIEPAGSQLFDGDGFGWACWGDDGRLLYSYHPLTGTLSDVVFFADGELAPLDGGGVFLADPANGQAVAPDRAELLGTSVEDDTGHARWALFRGEQRVEVEYVFRVWGKSMVIDVLCPGGNVAEVRFGRATGEMVANPRLVTLPYLTYGGSRPAVLVMGPPEKPWFLTGYPDWYRSNASRLEARNKVDADGGACYNGAAIYTPKTDGKRNDCVERLFVTLSNRFEEVLPTIANPRSPWFNVTSDRVWIAHGAGDRQRDYAHWAEIHRLGMTQILITDHESGWRDNGESFTLRTRTAPGRGGDESQAWYAKAIQDLGYVYGIYNNYTDFAPVNEHWSEDYVARVSDGQWRPAWPRCYNLKPSRAVELEAKLAPIIESKFRLSTAYCDVHTAVQPWDYCDFDARVPGAGTFAATYYAYGEIMLHQKATWDGPVYSEGNSHWTYVGLTDGNYGQDQGGRLPVSPWLVDFDLRKMHPLGVGFGMGYPAMFYPYNEGLGSDPVERVRRLDRFLAATVAFGHTGFFVQDLGHTGAARSYFNIQQLANLYAPVQVTRIQYAAADGTLLDTSDAVASDAYERSQIRTTYQNGVVTIVNGHPTEPWSCEVPHALLEAVGLDGEDRLTLCPNGYVGYLMEGNDVRLAVVSTEVDGHRVDYADTADYAFVDGRGSFTRFAKAAASGSCSAIYDGKGGAEVIPYDGCSQMAFALGGKAADAVALDLDRREIGPAETRYCRGLVHVMPVEGAISYRLTPKDAPKPLLRSERTEVAPGERVSVQGAQEHAFGVPRDATPGTILFAEFEGASIDFLVRPMVDAKLTLPTAEERTRGGASMRLALTSRLPEATDVEVRLGQETQRLTLPVGEGRTLGFAFEEPTEEQVRELPLTVTSARSEYRRSWWVKAEEATAEIAPVPEGFTAGYRYRGAEETPMGGNTGAMAIRTNSSCGDVIRPALFMHPPWQGGVGYSFALLDAVSLPTVPAAVLRCKVGKQDGSDPGDGILFKVAVVDDAGLETEIARTVVTEHTWLPLEGSLEAWAGKTIRLKLIADVGEADNSSGDWASFAEMRIETPEPVLGVTLHDGPVELKHAPGPNPLAGVTLDQLRRARRGWVSYEAVGLDTQPPYVSDLVVSGVNVGHMPAGHGDETKSLWGDPVRIDLTPEAIAALLPTTVLKISNTGQDFFKVRHFFIILELEDGHLFSSDLHTPAYTQPPTWPYAEGIGVPFGDEITVDVRFALEDGDG